MVAWESSESSVTVTHGRWQELLATRVSPAIRRCVASNGGRNMGMRISCHLGVYTARHLVLVVVIRILITVTNKSFLPPKALR